MFKNVTLPPDPFVMTGFFANGRLQQLLTIRPFSIVHNCHSASLTPQAMTLVPGKVQPSLMLAANSVFLQTNRPFLSIFQI